jgi:hypothetical protein
MVEAMRSRRQGQVNREARSMTIQRGDLSCQDRFLGAHALLASCAVHTLQLPRVGAGSGGTDRLKHDWAVQVVARLTTYDLTTQDRVF